MEKAGKGQATSTEDVVADGQDRAELARQEQSLAEERARSEAELIAEIRLRIAAEQEAIRKNVERSRLERQAGESAREAAQAEERLAEVLREKNTVAERARNMAEIRAREERAAIAAEEEKIRAEALAAVAFRKRTAAAKGASQIASAGMEMKPGLPGEEETAAGRNGESVQPGRTGNQAMPDEPGGAPPPVESAVLDWREEPWLRSWTDEAAGRTVPPAVPKGLVVLAVAMAVIVAGGLAWTLYSGMAGTIPGRDTLKHEIPVPPHVSGRQAADGAPQKDNSPPSQNTDPIQPMPPGK